MFHGFVLLLTTHALFRVTADAKFIPLFQRKLTFPRSNEIMSCVYNLTNLPYRGSSHLPSRREVSYTDTLVQQMHLYVWLSPVEGQDASVRILHQRSRSKPWKSAVSTQHKLLFPSLSVSLGGNSNRINGDEAGFSVALHSNRGCKVVSLWWKKKYCLVLCAQ